MGAKHVMWGVAGHVVLVAELCSGSQVLRLCFILSLSAGVETSEKALKGDNLDKAARLGFAGLLPSELWNATRLFISARVRARPLCLPLLPP